MKSVIINNNNYELIEGESIYECVSRNITCNEIPTLCFDEALKPFGACRICIAEVKHHGSDDFKILASCHTPAMDKMHILTNSTSLIKTRTSILELLLSNYPKDKLKPLDGENPTEFQKLLSEYNISNTRYPSEKETGKIEKKHTYIKFNPNECIHCYKCIRACDEVQGQFVLSMAGRGIKSHIIQGISTDFAFDDCISCGRCVQICPTNALNDCYNSKSTAFDKKVKTICGYCGVGCNLEVKVKNNKIVAINGVEDAQTNQGHTCVKGRYAFEYANHPDRLNSPMIRRNGELVKVSWDEAMNYIKKRLNNIKNNFGADSIAAISSARCTNEENYLMQKFMRVVIKNNNIDGCARVCHSPTAFGMQKTYGTGAATNSIDEIPKADCILIFGANPTNAHPVIGAKIKQAVIKGAKLIIIDPVLSELSKYAHCCLQPRPGSNTALLSMLCYYLIKFDYVDTDFVNNRCEGFDEFKNKIMSQDIDYLEKICDVSKEDVKKATNIYGMADNAMSFHGLGITEHYQGSKAIMLLASLIMMTGNMARAGVGMNPLRGQNNVQGAVDMGVQPDFGAGYLDYSKKEVQQHFEKNYNATIPTQAGLKIPQMFAAAKEGKLKAMWIIGEDVLQTDPNSCKVKDSLSKLDLLIVQELFLTQTCAMADVVLPAASFFEKDGTFTNTERRIQRVNKAIEPIKGCKADGEIICDIMNRMGYNQGSYNPKKTLKEISKVVPFLSGISWENIANNDKQWPITKDGNDTKILHKDGFKLQKGRFHFFNFQQTPEIVNNLEKYPYILTTTRKLEHYNCGSMTRRTPNINLLNRDVLIINPLDAKKEKISDNSVVEVCSSNGCTHLNVEISSNIKQGILSTTFHFPEIAINHLTGDVFDQNTMTPEYKVIAVKINK